MNSKLIINFIIFILVGLSGLILGILLSYKFSLEKLLPILFIFLFLAILGILFLYLLGRVGDKFIKVVKDKEILQESNDELKNLKDRIEVGREVNRDESNKSIEKEEEEKEDIEFKPYIFLETGKGLLSLIDMELKRKIVEVRYNLAKELGIVAPLIVVKKNNDIKFNMYVIKIKDVEVASGEVYVDRFLTQ